MQTATGVLMPEKPDNPEVPDSGYQFDDPEIAAVWANWVHEAEEEWATELSGFFNPQKENFLIRLLAWGGLKIALLRLSRDAALRKTAIDKLDIAFAALTEAHAALMAIPEERRESTLDPGNLSNICATLKEYRDDYQKHSTLIRPKPKHRPADDEFFLAIEQLAIIYMLKERRLPKVTYRRANRRYQGHFLDWVLPSLRGAGYATNEQACAHQIQRFLSSWPLLRHVRLVELSEPQCKIRAGQKS